MRRALLCLTLAACAGGPTDTAKGPERAAAGTCGTYGPWSVYDASSSVGLCRAFVGTEYRPGGSLESAAADVGAEAGASCPTEGLIACCVLGAEGSSETVDYTYLNTLVDLDMVELSCGAGDFTRFEAPPSVEVTEPEDGEIVTETIDLSAEVLALGEIVSVEFAVDDGVAGTVDEEPWTVEWNTCDVANGVHSVTARATDAAGQEASDIVTVTVANPLAVELDADPYGDTPQRWLYAYTGGGAAIVEVTYNVDGTVLTVDSPDGTGQACNLSCDGSCARYATEFDFSAWPNGSYIATVKVTDADGVIAEDFETVWVDRDGDDDGHDAIAWGGEDCDDGDGDTRPGAAPGDSTTACMADSDGDGYGDNDPDAGVSAGTDCDDNDEQTWPGAAANESASECMTDADGDGYGDDTPDTGVTAGSDCDDGDEDESPATLEVCNDRDDNCNDEVDEGEDLDADGYTVCDCDDTNAAVNPGAFDLCGNGIDDDCGGAACGVTDESLSLADASLIGTSADAFAGYAVAGAGDVNGDGYADVLVGSPGDDGNGEDAGGAYVIFGTDAPEWSSASAQWLGAAADDVAGWAVAGVGDVNLDGFADMLVGAKWVDDGGSDAGAAYLLLGSSTPGSGTLIDADATYTGGADNDFAGEAVAHAGDFNGDGYADLVVGAYQNDEAASNAGAACLFLGSAAPSSRLLVEADATYWGEATDDQAGHALGGGGDVNGDGMDDLMIGAYYNSDAGTDAGAAYLVLGSASPLSTSLSAADATFDGAASYDVAGWSVAVAGDVDADGYADVLVGAKWNDDPDADEGAAFLVLGSAAPVSLGLDLADARFYGEEDYADAGQSVAAAGDVDADGFADFIVGADLTGSGGAAYLVLGEAAPATASLASSDATLSGESADSKAGWAVGGAGDVNADGFGDLVVGAPETSTGTAYLLLGGSE